MQVGLYSCGGILILLRVTLKYVIPKVPDRKMRVHRALDRTKYLNKVSMQ